MSESQRLWGDGIHDDTAGLQRLIDTSAHELILPAPNVCYRISRPLELPSDFSLTLPRYAVIRLADGANCVMLKNKTVDAFGSRTDIPLWGYLDLYAPDAPCHNIRIQGGVWDCNNLGQKPNPIQSNDYTPIGFWGFGMLFYNVRGLVLRDMTFRDPLNFCVTMDTVSDFTVENIDFDFNYGNPTAVNMDGIHLTGNCYRGIIRNLHGACYDDMVALNADEGSCGPISDVEICGVFANDSHSAVRLLTVQNPVTNIHIHDVFGTYYQYCIGITKYYDGEAAGYYDGIHLDHIYASKAERLDVYQKKGSYVYPLIWVEGGQRIGALTIEHVRRCEETVAVSTVHVGCDTSVDALRLCDIRSENRTDTSFVPFENLGSVSHLDCDISLEEITEAI